MKELKPAKPRSLARGASLPADVKKVIDTVRANGDSALKNYNKEFDGCTRQTLRITREEIEAAYAQLPLEDVADIKEAAANIRAFAEQQKKCFKTLENFSPRAGISLGHRVIPVDACCCYVPGGSYPLFSTALMLGIPANVAGVPRVIACSPVKKNTNDINPYTLVAMDIAGIDEIYAVGGAQAIAAAAYGTESIAPVDMIVGPGNSFVTEAKRQCYGKVGIDFLAGPSEVMAIADETADPHTIAADLLAQSEHDVVAKAILVTTSESLGKAVISEVESQLACLSTAAIAEKSWADYGEVLLADSLDEAIAYANDYAPEHLEVCVCGVAARSAEYASDNESDTSADIINKLRNYGSLFIGQNTAEVFGDYASGTNHTLPTLGAARYTGGVWVGTFLKVCTDQSMTDEASRKLAPLVERLAEKEGLMAHKYAATCRKK
jgi:histidinol dehydrogenase